MIIRTFRGAVIPDLLEGAIREPTLLPKRKPSELAADLDRSRWTVGARVFDPDFGVGTVEHIYDPKTEGSHSLQATVTARFSGQQSASRPIRNLLPVLSLSQLLTAARLPEDIASEVAVDPRIVPDVPADPRRHFPEPHYRHTRVREVKRAFRFVSGARSEAMQKRLTRTRVGARELAQQAGVTHSSVNAMSHGRPVTQDVYRWVEEALTGLEAQHVVGTRFVAPRSMKALRSVIDKVDALGWSHETMGLNCGVSGRFLQMIQTGHTKKVTRETAVNIVRGLKTLLAAAAPLPPLGFNLADIAQLEQRLRSYKSLPNAILVPVLAQALASILQEAKTQGAGTQKLRGKTDLEPLAIQRARSGVKPPRLDTALRLLKALVELRGPDQFETRSAS